MMRGYSPTLEHRIELQRNAAPWRPLYGSASNPPAEYSTRSWKKRVESQGSTPSCVGQAVSNVVEGVYYISSRGQVIELSRWFAWLECQRKDGGRLSPRRGCSIQSAQHVATKVGLPLESLCPFKGRDFDTEISPEAYADAATRKVVNSYWLDSYEKLIDFLHAGAGAAVIGVPWEFRRRSWHAVCLSGWYANGDIDGENSWGDDWDGDGYFRWPVAKVEKYFRTSGVVCVGLSDMDVPQTRGWDWSNFLV